MKKRENALPLTEPIPEPDQHSLVRTFVKNAEFPVSGYYLDFANLYMNLIRWQWHEEVEFFVVESGEACLLLPDNKITLRTGDGVFINQNQLHSIHSTGTSFCTLRVLKFHPALLFGYGQTQLSVKYLNPVLSSPSIRCMPFLGDTAKDSRMISLIRESISLYLENQFGCELILKSLLCQLWYELLLLFRVESKKAVPLPAQSGIDSERTKHAILYIEEHHRESLTLEEIAASIHVSKSECCRCFQRSLGLTPFEYLMKYRIFESTRKMMQGAAEAESISALAASVGFNSPSYYNKLFRKYVKCTPSEYKKALQNGSAVASDLFPE